MNNYKELKVWQRSVDFAIDIYEATKNFPKDEQYGLTSQMRRCSVSVSSNLAEGSGRNTKKDFNRFLAISYGSTCELETQLIIANKVGLITDTKFKALCKDIIEIQKMNYALRKSLNL